MKRRQAGQLSSNQSPFIQVVRNNLSVAAFLVASIAGMLIVYQYFSPRGVTAEVERTEQEILGGIGADQDSAVFTQDDGIYEALSDSTVSEFALAEGAGAERIGLIAGHSSFDSGTVCADGLTEVQVNEAVAERTASMLRASGIEVDILDEYDPRLDGYSASALVSIHVDSCDFINELATGFKISGSTFTDSTQLSICVQQNYSQATNLEYHPNSITPEMVGYHAFRKISSGTPAIIIEIGFLYLDREILTNRIDDVAKGLHDGIMCYLDQQT